MFVSKRKSYLEHQITQNQHQENKFPVCNFDGFLDFVGGDAINQKEQKDTAGND